MQNYGGSDWKFDADLLVSRWNVFKKTVDCNTAEVIQIAKLCFSARRNMDKREEQTFLSFLTEKKVDGKMLLEYDEDKFAKDIVAFSSNEEFEDLSREILQELKEVNDYVRREIKESLEWKKVSVFSHRVLY